MPLTVLMDCFNEQLQINARSRSLPPLGFFKASDMFRARFGSLILGSYFSKIRGADGSHIIGYDSETLVRSGTGKELHIEEVYNSLNEPDHIVQLDRLVRTLHSLNYLQKFSGSSQADNEILSLKVHPRHIASISANYGKVFEAILSDCGLGPERVLLHTRLLGTATLPHFRQAFLGYRARGYKVGVDIHKAEDLELLKELGLEPDVVYLHAPEKEPSIYDKSLHLPPLRSLKIFENTKHFLVAGEEESPYGNPAEFDGSLTRYRQSPSYLAL